MRIYIILVGLALISACTTNNSKNSQDITINDSDTAITGKTLAIQTMSQNTEINFQALLKEIKKSYPETQFNEELYSKWVLSLADQLDPKKLILTEEDIKNSTKAYTPKTFNQSKPRAIFSLLYSWEESAIEIQNRLPTWSKDLGSAVTNMEKITNRPNSKDSLFDRWNQLLVNQSSLINKHSTDPQKTAQLLTDRHTLSLAYTLEEIKSDSSNFVLGSLLKTIDSNASYISPTTLSSYESSLKNAGLGMILGSKGNQIHIISMTPTGPAKISQKLQEGDQIIALRSDHLAYTPTIAMPLEDVVKLIRGAPKTAIDLQVKRGDQIRWVKLTRDFIRVQSPQVTHEFFTTGSNKKISVIKIPSFYMDFEAYQKRDPYFKSCTRDLLSSFKVINTHNVDGVIIDLRNNGGGSLLEGYQSLDSVLKPGVVLQTKDNNEESIRKYKTRASEFYTGPLLVLINEKSAGSAEIFAAAIQDYKRGIIAGSNSFGLGYLYSLPPLPAGRAKIASSKLYRVTGTPFSTTGVTPDIAFQVINNVHSKREIKALKIQTYSNNYNLDDLYKILKESSHPYNFEDKDLESGLIILEGMINSRR